MLSVKSSFGLDARRFDLDPAAGLAGLRRLVRQAHRELRGRGDLRDVQLDLFCRTGEGRWQPMYSDGAVAASGRHAGADGTVRIKVTVAEGYSGASTRMPSSVTASSRSTLRTCTITTASTRTASTRTATQRTAVSSAPSSSVDSALMRSELGLAIQGVPRKAKGKPVPAMDAEQRMRKLVAPMKRERLGTPPGDKIGRLPAHQLHNAKAAFKKRDPKPTSFRRFYQRGDIPVKIFHSGGRNRVEWLTPVAEVDFSLLFPYFVEGIREPKDPCKFLARTGTLDLIHSADAGAKMLEVIDRVAPALVDNLETRNIDVLCCTLRTMQEMMRVEREVAVALVPYLRHILPVLRIFRNKTTNIGDQIEFSQNGHPNVADQIEETLATLERGADACGVDTFPEIKRYLPTYESALVGDQPRTAKHAWEAINIVGKAI